MTASGRLPGLLRHLDQALLSADGAACTDADLLDRWIDWGDEGAFEALVWRHGPMVLGVCRRVLGNSADAEDSFQATFLVLVRKARSIVPRSRVGNWLHGVAHRTASNARAMNAERKRREMQSERRHDPAPPPAEEELLARLDEELRRLPEKYRAPIVLCHLEGRGVLEAARQLGLPQGTVASRLARGRALLAQRLGRGGGVIPAAAPAALPASLGGATVKAALLAAAGKVGAAGAASAKALLLSERVLKSMLLAKLTTGSSLLLLAALIGAVAAVAPLVPPQGLSEAAEGPAPAPAAGFARGMDNAAKARTMTARMTMYPGPGEKVYRLYVSGKRTRYDLVNTGWQGAPPREQVPVIAASVNDPEARRSLAIHFAERKYDTTALPAGKGEVPDLVGQLRRAKDGATRSLGDEVVGGEKARGYAVRIDGLAGAPRGAAEMWVSLRTGLPVRVRAVDKFRGGTFVTEYDEFAWDVPLAEELFRTTPPEGFKEVPLPWPEPPVRPAGR